MDQQLANYFFEEVSKALTFLVNKYSFTGPEFEINDRISFAFVIYMKKNLAIEFILDQREEDIACKISRVVNGKKTPYYAVDEGGVRVRENLSSLLTRRGVKESLFTRVGELEFRERITITLSDFAQMLQKHGQDILNDSPTALD